jgi:hypothetical protein
MDTCTEEGAAFSAFVKVVHMIELHPKIRIKHTPLVTNKEFYYTRILTSAFSMLIFPLLTFSGTILS